MLALAFDVGKTAAVARVRLLTDTTRTPLALERDRRRLVARLRTAISAWRFGRQRGTSQVTLPLVFERTRGLR
jgi:hypothetical protein